MIERIKDILKVKPHKMGFALSGGGAKGFSHIGAIKALLDNDFEPDIISGVSAGSIVGAFYCDGYAPDEISDIFSTITYGDMLGLRLPRKGLLSMDPFRRTLKKYLRAKRIEDLPLPLVIVATDLDRGAVCQFRTGNLLEAICASCSIPVMFPPVEIRGVNYVDGGVLQNFPVSTIREECKTVVGINVTPLVSRHYSETITSIGFRSFRFMACANSLDDKKLCDLLIDIDDADNYTMFDLDHREELIDIGYATSMEEINVYLSK